MQIKLVDLTGAFLILGIGLGAGILCFLIELIVAKYRREMNLAREMARRGPEKKSNPPSLASVKVPIAVGQVPNKGQPRPSPIEEEIKKSPAQPIRSLVQEKKIAGATGNDVKQLIKHKKSLRSRRIRGCGTRISIYYCMHLYLVIQNLLHTKKKTRRTFASTEDSIYKHN